MRTLKGQKDVYKGVTFDLETVKPPFESPQEFKEVITSTSCFEYRITIRYSRGIQEKGT